MMERPGAVQIVDISRWAVSLSFCVSLAIVKLGTGSSAIRFASIFLQVLEKATSRNAVLP